MSTIVIFRSDIATIFKGLFQFRKNEESVFAAKILLSMIPAGLVGFLLKDDIETLFLGEMMWVGAFLLLTGFILLLTSIAPKKSKGISYSHGFLAGIAQAVAILPGVSRSGATISTMLYLGIDKEKAARFSFLMVIPLVLGATLLDVKDLSETGTSPAIGWEVLLAGFLAAFISGLLACKLMLKIVKNGKLSWFAVYCFVVGVAIMIF